MDFKNESSDLPKINRRKLFNDNKLINLGSTTVNRNPNKNNELANEKYVNDSLGGGNFLRFIQTLQKCLKNSVGNVVYNPTKYDKIQITDITIIKTPSTGGYLLQQWYIKCNDQRIRENTKVYKISKSKLSNR